jgi:hypothetical protein
MLRITVVQNSDAMTFKLIGRVAGPWSAELYGLWEEAAPLLDRRKMVLDLRATTYADAGGVRVLKAIYSQTRANVIVGARWTRYLADEVMTGATNLAELEN